MKYKKESLDKLLHIIIGICQDDENAWFRDKLVELIFKPHLVESEFEKDGFSSFFTLLKKQFKIKAKYLYKDIPDKKLKSELINDCVKMYWFQVNNDIQSMFIQAFSQMENMLNYYSTKSNVYEKVEKNKNHYQHVFNDKFTVSCFNGYFNNNLPKSISSVNIWSKLVYWAYDTEHAGFMVTNNYNFSNLINIRNDNIHKDSISEKKSNGYVLTLKKEDYTAFSFYINILKEISKTLQNIDTTIQIFPFEHTNVNLSGPKIIGKIDLDTLKKRK